MMNGLWIKILVIALIFIGEAISIFAEMVGARSNNIASEPFWQIFLKVFLIIAIAGGFLVLGYMLGFNAFKNIWIVSVASITSILIMEPILAWAFFKQAPTIGATIGFVMGGGRADCLNFFLKI